MLIECESCRVRDLACGDCVVTALLADGDGHGEVGEPAVDLDEAEQRALEVLADAGLIPPLRLSARTGTLDERAS